MQDEMATAKARSASETNRVKELEVRRVECEELKALLAYRHSVSDAERGVNSAINKLAAKIASYHNK